MERLLRCTVHIESSQNKFLFKITIQKTGKILQGDMQIDMNTDHSFR